MVRKHELPSGEVNGSASISIHCSRYTTFARYILSSMAVMLAISAHILVVVLVQVSLPANNLISIDDSRPKFSQVPDLPQCSAACNNLSNTQPPSYSAAAPYAGTRLRLPEYVHKMENRKMGCYDRACTSLQSTSASRNMCAFNGKIFAVL